MKKFGTERMRGHLGVKVLIGIIAMVLVVDFLCVLYNYANFIHVNRRYMASLAETMANTCNLVIDGDKAEKYLENRKRDTAYYETWNKLVDYRNTNEDIIDLRVVRFDEEGANYIFDTDLSDSGAYLGDRCDFDSVQMDYKLRLIECREILSLEYSTHSDIYMPITTSYSVPVAYVIVGISNERNNEEQRGYLIRLTVMMSLLMVVFGVVLEMFLQNHVISHINALTKAAASYEGVKAVSLDDSPLQKVRIKTGDELERLLRSMKKMERDIVHSSTELILATWNSQHDSMTTLYNKGYYMDVIKKWADSMTVGVIYLDIDNLKKMNDTYGHERGDEVIIKTAEFAKDYLSDEMVCCRIGGDEFVILIPEISEEDLEAMIADMRQNPNGMLATWCKDFECRIAIGGARRQRREKLVETIKRAEVQMYGNKHATR